MENSLLVVRETNNNVLRIATDDRDKFLRSGTEWTR